MFRNFSNSKSRFFKFTFISKNITASTSIYQLPAVEYLLTRLWLKGEMQKKKKTNTPEKISHTVSYLTIKKSERTKRVIKKSTHVKWGVVEKCMS